MQPSFKVYNVKLVWEYCLPAAHISGCWYRKFCVNCGHYHCYRMLLLLLQQVTRYDYIAIVFTCFLPPLDGNVASSIMGIILPMFLPMSSQLMKTQNRVSIAT